MRFAVVVALACSACDLVFPIEFIDEVAHLPASNEDVGVALLSIPLGARFTVDTSASPPTLSGEFGVTTFDDARQERTGSDVLVMRVDTLTVEGALVITGDRPLIIIANAITVSGTIDASAFGARPGPGGGRPDLDDPGQGGVGVSDGTNDGSRTGGGGGGFASGAATSGRVDCNQPFDAAPAGLELGDETLEILQGGGAGGAGGNMCPTAAARGGGGAGGGALQLSARDSIAIIGNGALLAGGGGGDGGIGESACIPPGNGDGGGGGGGAGGALYLDARTITNTGTIAANGGGGGGGGRGLELLAGDGGDGSPGKDALDALMPSKGGGSSAKGTFGGDGAIAGDATAGANGMCGADPTPKSFNTGGGGGSAGRIVLRSDVKVDAIGDVTPTPFELPRVSRLP